MITPAQLVRTDPGVLLGDIDGQIVAMQVETGKYLHFNETGSAIFRILTKDESVSLSEICRKISEIFEVDEEYCEEPVSAFLGRCRELGLVIVTESV